MKFPSRETGGGGLRWNHQQTFRISTKKNTNNTNRWKAQHNPGLEGMTETFSWDPPNATWKPQEIAGPNSRPY